MKILPAHSNGDTPPAAGAPTRQTAVMGSWAPSVRISSRDEPARAKVPSPAEDMPEDLAQDSRKGVMESFDTDIHQLTTIKCLSPELPFWTRAMYLAGSATIVLLQTLVLTAILFGTFSPPCSNIRPDCPVGMWCPYAGSSVSHCTSCAKSTKTIESFNATKFCRAGYCSEESCTEDVLGKYVSGVGANEQLNARFLAQMCESCSDGAGRFVFFHNAVGDALDLMSASDWMSLLFVVALVALEVSAEERAVLLCKFIRAQHGGAASLRWWKISLAVIGDLRYLCNLVLVMTVSGLVLYRGADALNICLNALAVLFVLEADNVVYSNGLSDRLKKAFEADFLQKLTLGQGDEERLEAMRAAQLVLVPILCVGTIQLFGRSSDQNLNHAVLISVLMVLPLTLEVAFGVHRVRRAPCNAARVERLLLLACRRAAGVLLVSVVASMVPRINRRSWDPPPSSSDIFIAASYQ